MRLDYQACRIYPRLIFKKMTAISRFAIFFLLTRALFLGLTKVSVLKMKGHEGHEWPTISLFVLTPAASCPAEELLGLTVPEKLLEPLPARLFHRLLGELELDGGRGLGVAAVTTGLVVTGHLQVRLVVVQRRQGTQ